MIPRSNIYLAPDYKHLADGAACTAAAAHTGRVTHIVEISHTLANVTLSGPDRRTEGRESDQTETERELGAEG